MLERALVLPCWEITRAPQILEQSRRGCGGGTEGGGGMRATRRGRWGFPGRSGFPPRAAAGVWAPRPGGSCAGGVGPRPPSPHFSACTGAPPLRRAPLGRPTELSAHRSSGRLVPIRAVPVPASRGAGRGDLPGPPPQILQVLKATGFPEEPL